MAETISKTERLRQITSVLRKHSFISNFYHQTNPDEVLATFQELGPAFIKLGQLLSTRTDLVSPEYIEALRTLQDKVPADPYDVVSNIFENETGKPISKVFQSFDKKPFASASVGQCHYATLQNGQKVVVKVQHPAVGQLINVDLALFKRAIRLLKYVPGDLSVVDLNAVVDQLGASLLSEVNTLDEVQNGLKFYKLNNNDGIFRVPEVYPEYCHPRILVNQAMPGKSIKYLVDKKNNDQLAEVKKDIGNRLIQNFIKQVFVDHFFHADPHPGNILFYEEDRNEKQVISSHEKQFGNVTLHLSTESSLPPYRLVYLDFGMMGHLSPTLTDDIAQVVISLTSKDDYKISQAILNVCNQNGPVDEAKFAKEFGRFIHPYLNQTISTINIPQMIYSISQLCQNNNLQLKSEVTLLFKAFGTLEGTIAKLNPTISMMEVARPFAKKYFKRHFNFKESLLDAAIKTYSGIEAASEFPQKITRVLDNIENGNSKINLHYSGQGKVLDSLNRLLNRLLIVIMLASLILSSSVLVVGSRDKVIYRLGVAGWAIAIITCVILVISSIYHGWKRRK